MTLTLPRAKLLSTSKVFPLGEPNFPSQITRMTHACLGRKPTLPRPKGHMVVIAASTGEPNSSCRASSRAISKRYLFGKTSNFLDQIGSDNHDAPVQELTFHPARERF